MPVEWTMTSNENVSSFVPLLQGGGTQTRSQNVTIGDALEGSGYKVTGGAGRAPEEAIKGPDGTMKGGTYVDITAKKDGVTIRIQTVTTLSDGKTPTPAEQTAAARIRQAFPKDKLYLVPKQVPNK
jgi:filamentous hemagglutinin